MNRLKSALENLDRSVDRMEKTMTERFGAMESDLRRARTECEGANNKAKVAQKVGDRLDQVIGQLETILGEGK